jgi:outer membrane protein assembly factor BamB
MDRTRRTLALLLVVFAPAGAVAQEPPQKVLVFAASTHGYAYALDAATGAEVWQCRLHAKVLASPVLTGKLLLVATSDALARGDEAREREGRILGLHTDTGTPAWDVRLGPPIDHAPAVVEDRVLVGDEAGFVHALEASSGRLLWRRELGAAVIRDVLVSEGLAFFVTKDGSIHALSPASGETRWRSKNYGRTPTVPRPSGDLLIVGFRPGPSDRSDPKPTLVALDAKTGETRWSFAGAGAIGADPAVSGGTVFVLCHDLHLRAVAAETGKLRWERGLGDHETTFLSSVVCAPVVAGGVVYVNAQGLRALATGTGEEIWSSGFEGRANGLALAGDLLLMGTYCLGPARKPGGAAPLFAVDARTGQLRWRVDREWGGFVGVPAVR